MENVLILALGLNATYQKILTFEKFEKNSVNRAKSLTATTGGKGQNFAVAANTLFHNSATVAHFLGGETGKFIYSFLAKKGVNQIVVWNENPTRTCTTLLCNSSNEMTEIIEPSAEISTSQKEELLSAILLQLSKLTITGVAISGTFPPGIGPDFYESVAKAKSIHNFTLLVDSFKEIEKTLNTGSVDILKINAFEIETLSGGKILSDAVTLCFSRYTIKYIAITDGPHSAHLYERDFVTTRIKKHWEFKIPKLDKVVNPIGAGDTCSAGLLSYFLHGDSIEEAFRKGLGAATASCMYLEPAVFTVVEAEKIWNQIEVIEQKVE